MREGVLQAAQSNGGHGMKLEPEAKNLRSLDLYGPSHRGLSLAAPIVLELLLLRDIQPPCIPSALLHVSSEAI